MQHATSRESDETYADDVLTVVVLCYNSGKFAERTIRSILDSTLANIRVICIDDASSDGSLALLQELQSELNFELISNQTNLGIPACCNVGLSLAHSEFIAIIGDDEVLPNRFKNDVDTLRSHPDAHWVCSLVELIDENSTLLRDFQQYWKGPNEITYIVETPQEVWLKGHRALTPTVTFRAETLRELNGWDESFPIEDKPLFMRLAQQKRRGIFRPEITTRYRRHSANFSGQFREEVFADEKKLLAQFENTLSNLQVLIKLSRDAHYWLLYFGVASGSIELALRNAEVRGARFVARSKFVRLVVLFLGFVTRKLPRRANLVSKYLLH